MPKTSDLTKQLAAATKELEQEQHDWKVKKGEIQRDTVRLKALVKDLARRSEASKNELLRLNQEIDTARLRKEELGSKNTILQGENTKLESDIDHNKTELGTILIELGNKKASVDSDLEEYALSRKKEIKEAILEANRELEAVKTELQQRNSELLSRKTELGELNQVYKEEQEELRHSNAETLVILKENKDKIDDSELKIGEITEQLKELEYKKYNVELSLAKAREEHDKFVEYEKRGRKILETKDRELQEKSNTLSTQSQFLKNQRSYLPEL